MRPLRDDHFTDRGKSMQILNRRNGECIQIGDNIRVSVCGVQGGQIKLGFEVPDHLGVHREEIYNRIREQQKTHEFSNDEALKSIAV